MSNPDWTEAPDDATHWDTRGAVWCKFSYFWCYGRWNYEAEIHDLAEDRYTPRPVEPATTAWDGTGFPPVGTVCEYQIWDKSWHAVEITAHARFGFCIVEPGSSGESYTGNDSNFRPLCTQAQIERTQLEKALNQLMGETDMGVIADAIIEMGYRQKN